jgi:uncharacterized protein YfaS (alpha-2-macroglobulin family)
MSPILRLFVPVLCFLLLQVTVSAQRYGMDDFYKIDSIALQAKPKEALALADKIYMQAKIDGNSPLFIKAVTYKMLFTSYLEEDAFDKVLAILRKDITTAKQPEKSVLQSLLADTYKKYLDANWYKIAKRTYVEELKDDHIEVWSVRKITEEILKNYLASIQEANLLQQTKIDHYDQVLIGEKSTRFLRPTLYDLLAHRAIDALIDTRINLQQVTPSSIDFNDPKWLSPREIFVSLPLLQNDSLSLQVEVLRIFQKLAQFHNNGNQKDALADVELKRLKFIFQRSNSSETAQSFIKALDGLKNRSKDTEIYADILVEQALLYKNASVELPVAKQNLQMAIELAKEALDRYPKSMGGQNAKKLIASINSKELTISLKSYLQPNLPAQLHFRYTNADTIYLKLYQGSASFNSFNYIEKKADYLKFITTHKCIKEWMVVTPKTTDYQEHTLLDQLQGLDLGHYILIGQTSKKDSPETAYSVANFGVTHLAFQHRQGKDEEQHFLITNSTTGAPIENVKIEPRYERNTNSQALKLISTDALGMAVSKAGRYSQALITKEKDSIYMDISNYRYRYGDEDDKKVILFTDRPIYRPGQTLYYKGLLISNEAGKKSVILPDEQISVTFEDTNDDEIDEVGHRTNDYGTFQGSFTIPMGKLNGQMQLVTPYGSISVQVEEYKRPTFEITFDKPNHTYILNDSVKVTGKASTYAGYTVGNASLKYVIFRKNIGPFDYRRTQDFNPSQIAFGQSKTNASGQFDFSFLAKAKDANKQYQFEIEVTITDINGETRTSRSSIMVGKKDIVLGVGLPTVLFINSKKDSIPFNILNLNNERIEGKIKAEWALLKTPDRLVNGSSFEAENYTLSQLQFINLFPHEAYKDESNITKWPVQEIKLVQDVGTKRGNGVLMLDNTTLKEGVYKVTFTATNAQGDTTTVNKYVTIYEPEPLSIVHHSQWLVAEKTMVEPNQEAIFRLAGLTKNSLAFYEIYDKEKLVEKAWIKISPKQQFIRIKARPEFEQSFAVQFTMTSHGQQYQALQQVYIIDKAKQLDIKFLTFRDKLQPGEKEQWKLQISNKYGEKRLAEMVATLYDASLDALYPMNWTTSLYSPFNYYEKKWNVGTNTIATGTKPYYLQTSSAYFSPLLRNYEQLNLFGYNFYGSYNYGYHEYLRKIQADPKTLTSEAKIKLRELAKGKQYYGVVLDKLGYIIPGAVVGNGKNKTTTNALGIYAINAAPGDMLSCMAIGYKAGKVKVGTKRQIDITLSEDQNHLNETVVVGYGTTTKRNLAGSVAQVAGDQSDYRRESLIFGASIGTGLPPSPSPEIKIRGASSIPGTTTLPNIVPRSNFNESAFFYPALRTDENGMINIEFTIPQSLTKYKMMGFAHTKDLNTAFISNELVTQKQLAISANAPRFFREGDTITFSAKLNNLSGKALIGEAQLELKDALSGQHIQLQTSATKLKQPFELSNEGNEVLKWTLVIPSGLSAISYKIVAAAGKFSDGEEMTIPVLPNKMLVTETLPMSVRGNTTKTFNFGKLVSSGPSNTLRSQALTFEFTSNPVWYAVQALPYLMEYPYECAEQTFSRFYANSFATGIINSDPKIRTVFEAWKQTKDGEALLSNLEKNQELKSILLEETPWVRNANNENERKKRLATLFDLNRMSYELKANFEKLEGMQNAEGAFPWFNGMTSDRYITQHIVLGMGQLQKAKLINEKSFPTFKTMLNKAVIYLDAKLVADFKAEKEDKKVAHLPLHYLFARSYLNQENNSANFKQAYQYYLKKLSSTWQSTDTYQQAQAALVFSRAGNKAEALKIINLLKQTAQQSEEMGMYWKNNQNGWWWYQNPIETQAILIEAFDEVAADHKSVEEMKIWLLKNKQTTDWKTTKATAAACYALLLKGYHLLAESNEAEITIGNQPLSKLSEGNAPKEAGTGYQKVSIEGNKVTPTMGQVTIKNNNQTIAWGGLYWQYFEQLDKITPAATGVRIKKQLLLQQSSTKGEVLKALTSANRLAVGDLVKVRVEIYTDRDMEYVHLKDMRSSGLAPINVISHYKYQDGLGYYESTKDASTNFFISYMRKGTYVFEYPLRVTHSGNFSNGITSLQCMYAPEFSTHSEGIRITVK